MFKETKSRYVVMISNLMMIVITQLLKVENTFEKETDRENQKKLVDVDVCLCDCVSVYVGFFTNKTKS